MKKAFIKLMSSKKINQLRVLRWLSSNRKFKNNKLLLPIQLRQLRKLLLHNQLNKLHQLLLHQ